MALIDAMLMINPMERLGSPGSTCGIENLKKHPFFNGIDFNQPKSLCLTDDHRSLITGVESPIATPIIDTRRSGFSPTDFETESVVCRGYLLKKNRWFQKQIRYFHLYSNGELKYFKDVKKYKGKITLSEGTRILKTGKNQMEIPTGDKTYVFVEVDRKDQAELGGDPAGEHSEDHHVFTNDIDKWIEALTLVVQNL